MMTDNETIQLRKEIARLNRIIDIILDKNTQLEKELAAYSDASGRQIAPDHSTATLESTSTAMAGSNDVSVGGINKSFYSDNGNVNGIKRLSNSNRDIVSGSINSDDSIPDFTNGIIQPGNSIHNFEDGIKHANDSIYKNVIGINQPSAIAHEEKSGTNGNPLPATIRALKQVMGKTSDKGIRNTAIILLQLQQSPVNSLSSLRQLTHLSAGGMAKRIMALKKYGYIRRIGFQQYQLTEKSLQILHAAGK